MPIIHPKNGNEELKVNYAITFTNGRTHCQKVPFKMIRYYQNHVLDNILKENIQAITIFKEPL